MLAKTKIAKLEKDLEMVQKHCRVRLMTIEEAKKHIGRAERAVIDYVRPEFRKYTVYYIQPYNVAKAYNYTATGTALLVRFNAKGKAIKATVSRDYVHTTPQERLALDNSAVMRYLSDVLGIDRPSPSDPAYQRYQKLWDIVIGYAGFNHYQLINLW